MTSALCWHVTAQVTLKCTLHWICLLSHNALWLMFIEACHLWCPPVSFNCSTLALEAIMLSACTQYWKLPNCWRLHVLPSFLTRNVIVGNIFCVFLTLFPRLPPLWLFVQLSFQGGMWSLRPSLPLLTLDRVSRSHKVYWGPDWGFSRRHHAWSRQDYRVLETILKTFRFGYPSEPTVAALVSESFFGVSPCSEK